MKNTLQIALLVFLFSSCSKIIDIKPLTPIPVQYGKSEWQIELKTDWKNPYDASEIALNMVLNSPSGNELVLPCYFESGTSGASSLWKARFAPADTGSYSYRFQLLKAGTLIETSKPAEFSVATSESKGFLRVNNFYTLKYDNGDLFRGIGENICWESRDEDDSKYFETLHEDKRFNYEYMLTKLSANGGNFFRAWMIYWNLPIDWKTPINNSRYQSTTSAYNESAMQRMDAVVDLCDSLGIHMMLALESHVGYMGTGWDISNYNIKNGGTATTPLEFFTLPSAKAQYKNKLRLMVARYGYSPSIGAWEFFNEIDNAMYHGKPEDRIPDSVITAWHDEMSSYLKSVDPFKHIVTTSVSHRDVEGMNDLKNMDINQRHIYKYTTGIPGLLNDYTQKHNKPYVIGEFGYEWDWSKNFNDYATEFDNDFRRGLWYGLFSPTPILPMTWWWEFFENRNMMEYFIHVRLISDMMLASGNGNFTPVKLTTSIKQGQAMSIKCGNSVFTYLELQKPEKALQLMFENLDLSPKKVKCYNPTTGTWFEPNFSIGNEKKISIEGSVFKNSSEFILILE